MEYFLEMLLHEPNTALGAKFSFWVLKIPKNCILRNYIKEINFSQSDIEWINLIG